MDLAIHLGFCSFLENTIVHLYEERGLVRKRRYQYSNVENDLKIVDSRVLQAVSVNGEYFGHDYV